MDSNFFKNPRNEYIVIVNHDANLVLLSYGGPVPELRHWLEVNVGVENRTMQDVSKERPWRWRTWQLNRSDAFFFHSLRHAQLFALRWT